MDSSTPGTWPNIAITLRRSFRGQYCLYLKLEKCEFHCSTVQFHGYIVGQEGIHVDQGKVTAITEWMIPQSIKELQRFLGFAHFYRCFIKDFSLHTAYWNYFLPWDKYAQNSLRQNTSGLTPFQCILGYQPPFFPWMGEPAVDYWFRERERATRLTSTSSGQCGDIRASWMPGVSKPPSISQETRYGCPPRICVSTCPILRLPYRKLSPRYIWHINEVTYQLQLQPRYRIQPTLHVSLLKPFYPSTPEPEELDEPPPLEILDQPSIY